MLVRAVIAAILAGALAIGALYSIDRFLGRDIAAAPAEPPESESDMDAGDASEAPDPSVTDMGEMDMGETYGMDDPMAGGARDDASMGEPPIALPYAEGEAAQWLADVLAGTGPYAAADAYGGEGYGDVDLAELAALADEPQPEAPSAPRAGDFYEVFTASCQPSHVLLSCSIASRYTEWEDGGEAGPVTYESAQIVSFNMVKADDEPWRVDPDSVTVAAAG